MADYYSPMSITQLINNEDTSKQTTSKLTADALNQLTSNDKPSITLPPLSIHSSLPSTTSSSPIPTPSSYLSEPRFSFSSDISSIIDEDQPSQQQPYMDRVSPLVYSASSVYQQSTAQNGMKYGTDMVDPLSNPIYDKVPMEDHDVETMAAVNALARTTLTDEFDTGDDLRRRRLDDDASRKNRSRPHSRSTSPHRPYIKSATSLRHLHRHRPITHHPRQKINRSKWQQLVVHASSAAGTTAAVVSEESMKCLRYCLHWLQYATHHIQQQMHLLRNFLVSLATSSTVSEPTKQIRKESSPLADIQKEIILTLRKVVEVVSRYAGSGLPSHAKASVRSFILQLPGRWATLNTTATPHVATGDIPDHVKETSIKLLNFGGEAVEMLEEVETVFYDTIDRAEVWLDRLRVVGVASSGHQQGMET
ncbi:transcription factor Opi1-domain-containing protein [Chlamydoabsidia padenii]|nr:transcription factor Opi1-domain-containing protein [Chlamydoabsidia padenii]